MTTVVARTRAAHARRSTSVAAIPVNRAAIVEAHRESQIAALRRPIKQPANEFLAREARLLAVTRGKLK